MIFCVSQVYAVSYKGYADTYGGYVIHDCYNGGAQYGFSTSHGIEIIDGLFVGLGADLSALTYEHEVDDDAGEIETAFMVAGFAECRYNILRSKRISPFVGLRLGGGYNGIDEYAALYTSPMVGCTFNFTKKFGLDVGLSYSLFSNDTDFYYYYDHSNYDYDDKVKVNTHSIVVRVGVHF